MITVEQYFFGYPDHPGITQAHRDHAAGLLVLVNRLLGDALKARVLPTGNPVDGTLLSRYRTTDRNAGWRPQDCPIGAATSSHKTGQAIDIYDPQGKLDGWLNDIYLAAHGLYREHPSATNGWCHLTTRAPKSGKRTFLP